MIIPFNNDINTKMKKQNSLTSFQATTGEWLYIITILFALIVFFL